MGSSAVFQEHNGIVDISSRYSVDETVERVKNLLQSKGITLFVLIDHSGEAEKVGMKMPPTKLLIFGNPKHGTPVMLAAPSIAIDFPLKILVWENTAREIRISYNSPAYLVRRHGLPQGMVKSFGILENLATLATE
jgi:uncharacterized protein (DUF302 family)